MGVVAILSHHFERGAHVLFGREDEIDDIEGVPTTGDE